MVVLSGCAASKDLLDPKKPVTVTMWHHFGGMQQGTMEILLDEFNNTYGKDRGVIISVTSMKSTSELTNDLRMTAADDPGAMEMPDIATVYPAGAMELYNAGMLVNLDNYFTAQEIEAYIPRFVDEGRMPDGGLYVFPFAKSTEALFVNKTFFDRFSSATGVTLESLATFEGLADAAVKYYDWTDSLTPEIPNDGKAFFSADSWLNSAMVGTAQIGDEFVGTDVLNTSADSYKRVWDVTVIPALMGGYYVADGYTSSLSITGDILCSTGSTAGIAFYGNTITYPNNTIENVEFNVLPYPVFNDAKKIALQRGTGIIVAKSTAQKEYAAALFLKWFTAPEQNMRFVSETGYLPVTSEAYDEHMNVAIQNASNPVYRTFLETAEIMHKEYEFFIPPNIDTFSALSGAYENRIKDAMRQGRKQVLDGADVNAVSDDLFISFIR